MNTYSPEHYAATRQAALQRAERLRTETIDALLASIASALRRGTRNVLRLCHIPHPEF